VRDILDDLLRWWESGESAGVGTVVGTFKSAPRPAGAAMAVGPGGTAVGSVSGGCVEGAVYESASGIRDGDGAVLTRFGVSDGDAFAVGLTCGGIIDVFTERFSKADFPEFGELAASIKADERVALATIVAGRPDQIGRHMVVWVVRVAGSLGSERIDHSVRADALGLLVSGRTATLTYGLDGERMDTGLQVFVAAFAPAPRMLVFGAIDFATAVARIGTFLGYRVTVCDARPIFATKKRFPDADEVIIDWPHRYLEKQVEDGALDARTVICVLTHDPKFDVPALKVALKLDVAYIGAMGSRRTHFDRLDRLRAAGVPEDEIAKLVSPIGLNLGARTPEETAVSIAAQIISHTWQGDSLPLNITEGPIHSEPIAEAAAPPQSMATRLG
jgi:xanthine dehydrogenase accessory factor